MKYNLILFALILAPVVLLGQTEIVGAMKHVMWNGELEGKIDLDTISNKEHLYGLGPVEYLAGELLVLDGLCYISKVTSDSTMEIRQTFDVKAPFFGYASIDRWVEYEIPEHVSNLDMLESYVDEMTHDAPRPFFFQVKGKINTATIHVVNLPQGAAVSSPDEAHEGLTKYQLVGETVDILGFFSTEHQAVLTHHDTYTHMHLITADRQMMGHLDEVELKNGALYLPAPGQ